MLARLAGEPALPQLQRPRLRVSPYRLKREPGRANAETEMFVSISSIPPFPGYANTAREGESGLACGRLENCGAGAQNAFLFAGCGLVSSPSPGTALLRPRG